MSNLITRRGFLTALGIGAGAIAVTALIAEPRRRFWQVGRNAPVGDHFFQSDMRGLEAWLPIDPKSDHYFGLSRADLMRALREKYEAPHWVPKPEGAKTLAELQAEFDREIYGIESGMSMLARRTVNFEVGEMYHYGPAPGAVDTLRIIAIDKSAGTFTVSRT